MKYEASVLRADGTQERTTLVWDCCVAVGYAGRDQGSVRAHVDELVKLGVSRPYAIPAMYWIEPEKIFSQTKLVVVGGETSGEVEVFLARDGRGDLYVTLASDHTDRGLEKVSVSKAKQICSKIVAPCFWKVADVREHWDKIELASEIPDNKGGYRIYQKGTLGDLLPPERLWELALEDLPSAGKAGQMISLFSGTLAAHGGIVYAPEFRMMLSDPVLKRCVKFGYTVEQLPDRN